MIRHNCGLFGVYNSDKAIDLTYYGLFQLQHRGEEGSGIVGLTESGLFIRKNEGLLNELVKNEVGCSFPSSRAAIGHVRYSTTGSSSSINLQPFVVQYKDGFLAIAHNGNFVNYKDIKSELIKRGTVFHSTTDSEIFLHLVARSGAPELVEAIIDTTSKIEGAYAILVLSRDSLYAVRDPYGFRPLEMGELDGSIIFSSESCALNFLGAKHIRSVSRGEIVRVSKSGTESFFIPQKKPSRLCLFELIYFARPDSIIDGFNVYEFRKRAGKLLAELAPADADAVIAVPDSGMVSALGFAQRLNLPIELGLSRSYYIGRTFIKPRLYERESDVVFKYSPIGSVLNGKRVILVDDSLVRGTTSRRLIDIIRDAGAKEIHFRIASPPLKYPCFYGIDIPTKQELIASSLEIEDIKRFIGVDSLYYLPLEYLIGENLNRFCTACFSGEYPIPVGENY